MRVVLDTNAVISGLLWSGPPRRLLDAAISGTIEIFTSSILLAELRETLAYPRLAQRLSETGSSIDLIVDRYLAIAHLTAPAAITPTVLGDPDDDHVLACALSAEADLIVPATPCSSTSSTFTAFPSCPPQRSCGASRLKNHRHRDDDYPLLRRHARRDRSACGVSCDPQAAAGSSRPARDPVEPARSSALRRDDNQCPRRHTGISGPWRGP